jgi:hypothetical protein
VGDECIPQQAAQPPGLVPSELPRAACPVNPRPRNQRVYSAACASADGEPVTEYDAFEVEPGQRAWCGGSFLTVVEAKVMTVGQISELIFSSESARSHRFVVLRLEGNGATTGWIIGELDTPVYCLA